MRPLDIGEILDAAFRVYTRNFWTFIKIVAAVVVPLQIVSAIVLLSAVEDPETISGFEGDTEYTGEDDIGAVIAGTLGTGVLGWIAVLVTTAACVKAVGDAWLGARPDAGPSLRFAARRLGPLLWISVLQILLLIPAFIALIVPGIWLAISWIVAFPVLLLEDVRGRRALGRSFRLVRKRWWPTFGVVLAGYFIAGVVQAIIGAATTVPLAAGDAGDSLGATVALTTIGNTLATVLATPFQAAVAMLVYFDLRVRKEGLDLQLLAERIGAPAPAGGWAAPAQQPQGWPQPGAPQQAGWPQPGAPQQAGWPQQPPQQAGWAQQPPAGAAPSPAGAAAPPPPPPPPPPPGAAPPPPPAPAPPPEERSALWSQDPPPEYANDQPALAPPEPPPDERPRE